MPVLEDQLAASELKSGASRCRSRLSAMRVRTRPATSGWIADGAPLSLPQGLEEFDVRACAADVGAGDVELRHPVAAAAVPASMARAWARWASAASKRSTGVSISSLTCAGR